MNISNGKFIHSSRTNENTPTIVTKEHRPQKTMESKTVKYLGINTVYLHKIVY